MEIEYHAGGILNSFFFRFLARNELIKRLILGSTKTETFEGIHLCTCAKVFNVYASVELKNDVPGQRSEQCAFWDRIEENTFP
jgi:hypothetical protein